MSNLTNERIKESILDEIGSMSVNDFLDELKARPLMDLDDVGGISINGSRVTCHEAACLTVEKLYGIMWEEYPDE